MRVSWLVLLVVATLAYYFWTTVVSFDSAPQLRPVGYPETDHFNLLSHGFLNGHLYLDGAVPEELLRSPNPYDPAQRKSVEVLHDASFYRGKYYIYFGPAPVVTLLLPFTVLTGRDFPLPYAVWIFACIGYLALTGVFFSVQRRYFPRASIWTMTAALVALGGGSMIVALLRRPHIWELSGASGFGFFALSLLLLVRSLHAPRATPWAVAGGLFLGLAVASRPTYIVCSAMFLVPALIRGGGAASPLSNYGWRALIAAGIACGIVVAGLLAYNYARFDNPFEFGQKYQLSAIIEGDAQHFSLRYAWFNFRVYFLCLLRWLPTFPFHHGIVVPPTPNGYGGYEYAIGLFANLPFSLFSLVALGGLAVALGQRRTLDGCPAIVATIATATLLSAGLLLCYFGTCIRYMADFAPGFMLLAGCGLLAGEAKLQSRPALVVLRAIGFVLGVFSAFAAGAAVVHLYTPPHNPLPGYQAVARALNYPTYWLEERRWPSERPAEVTFSLSGERPARSEPLVTLTRGARVTAAVSVEFLPDGKVRFQYREAANDTAVLSRPFAVEPDVVQTLRVRIGGTYDDFDGHRGRLRGMYNGEQFWDTPVVSLEAFPGKMAFVSGRDFPGKILSAHAIGEATFARPTLGGARVRLRITPELVGRSLPLVTSGRTGAGDLLFVRIQEGGRATFGYDHWGDSLLLSEQIALPAGEHVIEFWIPAVARQLVVKVDDVIVWRRPAPFFPTSRQTFFLGSNPIGGTTCEPNLENAVIEARELPPP